MRRLASFLLLLAGLSPGLVGCSGACDGVNCGGGGVYVAWRDGDVPDAASYRLCIEGRCQSVEASPWNDGDTDRYVQAGEGRPEEPVAVRFEALAADGRVVSRFVGARAATGECCPAVSLQVDPPGRLVPPDD